MVRQRSGVDRPGPLQPGVERRTAVVIVLTALRDEYNAVLAHLSDLQVVRTSNGTRFEVGTFLGDRIDWRVHVAEIGMGNSRAAGIFTAAADAFGSDMALFVGVAGNLKPHDLCRGDVVIADNVHNLHAGKEVPGSDGAPYTSTRTLSFPASHAWSSWQSKWRVETGYPKLP